MAATKKTKVALEVLFVRAELKGIPEKALLKSRNMVQVDMIWPRSGVAKKSAMREAVFRKGVCDFAGEPWTKRVVFREEVEGRCGFAELQTMLEDDDCMLPYRWRKVSALTAAARCAEDVEALRNGIDRGYGCNDNGAWVKCGETTMAYFWTSPQRLSGARIVFDSEMTNRGKRMRKLEATTERAAMPKMMAKAFRVEARICGEWKCVFSDDLNILRFRKVAFASVDADALRLVVTATWGGEGERAHVFALDAL